jgi:hypothetical protein
MNDACPAFGASFGLHRSFGIVVANGAREGLSRRVQRVLASIRFQDAGFCGAGLFQQGEKMANEDEAYQAGLVFDRFRSRNEVPYLLILDCETRRFTIEQPASTARFRQWCQEVDKAIASGRHLVCVPVNKQNTEEIEAMGAGLGYTLWPSRTIISPADTGEADTKTDVSDGQARKKEDDLRRRLLARVGLR